MPDLSTLLLFFAGALALNFTPGPDMAFTAATAASAGRRAGAAFALTGGVVLFAVAMGAGAMRSRLADAVRIRRVVNLLATTVFGAIGLRLLLAARSI